jgi:hypothetical protein
VLPSPRPRLIRLLGALVLAGLPLAAPAEAGPGPGPAIRPKASNTDAMLWDKAMRLQARMWHHISPEGMLVYEHTQGAGPDTLSHEVLSVSDAAIWTGCYLGAQACRWHVTRDPDALRQVDRLLGSLELMSEITGTRGRLCRSVGRLSGRPRPGNVKDSPNRPGYVFLDDVSRDQLAGVVFGLALTIRFVDDPDVVRRAHDTLAHIGGRLAEDGMWLRRSGGRKAEYGELRHDVHLLPMVENGPFAAIGYAPFAVMASRATHPWWRQQKDKLDRAGWRRALTEQLTWLDAQISMSNVNMVHLALTPIALFGDALAGDNARKGLRSLHAATRGWWNAGTCACQLLADSGAGERVLLDEIRAVLHMMTESEIPPRDVGFERTGRIVTIRERGVVDWAWKIHVDAARLPAPGSPPHPTKSVTRADWLFAYWLSRAAGHLRPADGPGAAAIPPPCPMDLPPWMDGASR